MTMLVVKKARDIEVEHVWLIIVSLENERKPSYDMVRYMTTNIIVMFSMLDGHVGRPAGSGDRKGGWMYADVMKYDEKIKVILLLDVKDDIMRNQKDFDFWHLGYQMIKCPGGDERVVDKTLILSGMEKGIN
ncbi:hypothetical protein ACLOJK_007179 [Asimina triloba]